jgi:hypothetical protein
MKRSVAITGATPAFLRWAIWHPCDLRPLDAYRFPDQTFRTLRGVRELSIAKLEQRCSDEFCFHPSSIQDYGVEPTEIRGFQRNEIAAVFGGEPSIDECCGNCPANALARSLPNVAAGCFGFLSTTEFDLQRLLSGYAQQCDSQFDLVGRVQAAANQPGFEAEIAKQFGAGKVVWHRLWKSNILSVKKLTVVAKIFDRLVDDSDVELPKHVQVFYDAIRSCLDNGFPLHVELLPSGFSDGETWSLAASCPDCCYEPAEPKKLQKCLGCGRIGGISAGPKFRVLGTRPYSNLAGIIGEEKAKTEIEKLRPL